MYIPGSEELVIFICAFIGALLVSYGTMRIPGKYSWAIREVLPLEDLSLYLPSSYTKELLIPILCGVFLVENLSVILQGKVFPAR